jgi:hypothetical protein
VGGGGAGANARTQLDRHMIPWATILKHAPAILAAADALRARSRTSSTDKGAAIEARLASLEQGSRDSAQLLQDIAQQIQALAVAQEIAVRRARIAVGVAIAAGVVAICAGILAFVW